MARIGGRNVVFAWIVGVICAGVIGALVVLTVPLVTTGMGVIAGGSRADGQAAADDGPQECRDLYPEALWVSMQYAPGAKLAQTGDAPVSTASALVAALAPEVRFTCVWTADAGSISTTVAAVGTDAGSIAASALPAQGFSCSEREARTLCSRSESDLIETIEAGNGLWVSTSQTAWFPEQYASRVGNAVFASR